MDPLFTPLPEDLAALTDEALSEALTERLSTVERIEAEDAELLGDRSAADVLADLSSGVEQIESIRAEQGARVEAAEAYAVSVAELAARARPEEAATVADPEPETPEGDDPEPDTEPSAALAAETPDAAVVEEPVVDAAAPAPAEIAEPEVVTAAARRFARPPRATRDRQPISEAIEEGARLVASAGIRGIAPGTVLDRESLGHALIETHRVTSARGQGMAERIIVASAHAEFPEERVLTDNPTLNTERIQAVVGPDALVAAGGICAPLTPLYDLNICGAVADRPVKAALAGFQATRGGISYPTPLSLSQVADGVGVVTADEDALGGTFATKECVVVDCDPYTDAEIEAIYACIQHGNFGARTWPERVAALGDLLAVQHAKVAEIELLDAISADSTIITDEAKYGATSTLLQGILKASAAMRNRNRMRPETRLRAIFPAWAIDLLVADMVHFPSDRFERSRDGLAALLSSVGGVSVSWYLDGPTGKAQMFGAQGAGALLEFPTTVVWYLFAEGTWLFLDGGELDLGIVRDSVLNSTNDFQIFMETFEGAARVGCESYEITSTVCPNGAYPAGSTAFTC